MYSVHTGTYQLMTLKYVPGTYFFHRFGTRKPTFCIGLNLVHTSTYSRKKVCTEYILREKSTYQVQTGLCPFISVSYYSMVHTGMYRYVPGMYVPLVTIPDVDIVYNIVCHERYRMFTYDIVC